MIHPEHVEVYLKCRANPCLQLRRGIEATAMFMIDMERKLGALDWQDRRILILLAEGYTVAEIGRIMDWYSTKAKRKVNRVRAKHYNFTRNWYN